MQVSSLLNFFLNVFVESSISNMFTIIVVLFFSSLLLLQLASHLDMRICFDAIAQGKV